MRGISTKTLITFDLGDYIGGKVLNLDVVTPNIGVPELDPELRLRSVNPKNIQILWEVSVLAIKSEWRRRVEFREFQFIIEDIFALFDS